MPDNIPLLDLAPEIDAHWDELNAAIQEVLRSTRFINGPNVKAFEQEAADFLGVEHAVGLNSGTDALVIGLRALGVEPGDEVITTPFTFFATAEAISQVGATPVFVDIEPDTFNIDPAKVEDAVTDDTTAIVPVHLFGHAADMDPIMALAHDHDLKVLEDVAQAFGGEHNGHKLGSIGHAGAFSFFPSKNLGAYGDGGMIVTNDDDVAETARSLRHHGAKAGDKYTNIAIGHNSRLDELQAAILRVKLPHVDEANAGRRRVAARYAELLGELDDVVLPVEKDYARHVYHQYTIRVPAERRDELMQRLDKAGVSYAVYYKECVHRMPAYGHDAGTAPVAEAACAEVLSVPVWPAMSDPDQGRVAEAIVAALE